jgi:hypothetical protein
LVKEWEYLPFLNRKEADALYEKCLALPWKEESEPWQGEKKLAVHYGVSYSNAKNGGGPRSIEIPEIPAFLSDLAEKVSKQTKHPVNYVQCHRATPADVVRKHRDPGGVCLPMIVVGQERTFRINATKKLLEHGSLLVFNGGKTSHSMDVADKDENFNKNGREYRISLLFRYTTPSMREFGPGPKVKDAEYAQAVEDFLNPPLPLAVIEKQDSKTLASLNRARLALQEAKTVFDVLKVKDLAEAARVYAKAAKLSQESVNMATEIAILAARKAGDLLAQLEKSAGGRRTKTTTAATAAVSIYKKTLNETKTPARTATTWQKIAKVPEKKMQTYFETAKEEGLDCSSAGLLRFAKVGQGGEKKKAADKNRFDQAWAFLEKLYHDVDEIERENDLHEIIKKWKSTFTIYRDGRIVPGRLEA